MNFSGLSLDQAPPISIPLRYFLVAPLFAIVAAVLLLGEQGNGVQRYATAIIAAVHLITIGFFGMVMLGALTQMLPVIANATIKKVDYIATAAYLSILIGMVSMVAGFLLQQEIFLTLAYCCLGFGFLLMLASIINSITTVTNFTPTIRGMLNSLTFAFIIVIMGIFLLYEYASADISSFHMNVANIHSTLAIFGFALLLIVGVSFQVLPMFYVASNFSKFFEDRFIYFISIGLIGWSSVIFFAPSFLIAIKLYITVLFFFFTFALWKKLQTRKRKINDITIYYFTLATLFLPIGLLFWVGAYIIPEHFILLSGVFIGGAVLCMMQGMLYKIIPFLVWFHLNGQGYMSIPTMNEMIDKRLARWQFISFAGATIGFGLSFYIPFLYTPSLLFFIGSMVLLEYNIVTVYQLYKKTLTQKPDFDMNSFASMQE